MTDHQLFCQDVLRYGTDLTLVRHVGGSDCPCTEKTGVYSPEWHRNHPDDTDCESIGRTGTVVSELSIKAFVFNYTMVKTFVQFQVVGNVTARDMMIIGTVNTVDGAFLDLNTLDLLNDYFEYNGCRYRLKQSEILSSDEKVAQFAILRQIQGQE